MNLYVCPECGFEWKSNEDDDMCPECGANPNLEKEDVDYDKDDY